MDRDRSGYISFDEWLDFTYNHVCQKVSAWSQEATPANDLELSQMSRDQFISFCTKATSDQSSSEFEKLYAFLLRCFVMSDNDYDGKVDVEEFDMMVDLAATHVRRLGLAPTQKETYQSAAARRKARAKLFEAMD